MDLYSSHNKHGCFRNIRMGIPSGGHTMAYRHINCTDLRNLKGGRIRIGQSEGLADKRTH